MFEHAARELQKLGFEVAGVVSMEVPHLCAEPPVPMLVLREPQHQVWAFAFPSGAPAPGAPLTLQLWS
jgi:hypothetical protein